MKSLEGGSIDIPEPREKPLATRRQGTCLSSDDQVENGRLPVPRRSRSTVATIKP